MALSLDAGRLHGRAAHILRALREYDLIADWYVAERRGPIGVPEAQTLVDSLPRGAAVLDIGCGPGLPLTKVLVDGGCQVVGLDSSANMFRPLSPQLSRPPDNLCAHSRLRTERTLVRWRDGLGCHVPPDT